MAGIRVKTFSTPTIKDSFRKAGIWPINVKVVKDKMKKYAKSQSQLKEEPEPELPEPRTPRTIRQVEKKLDKLGYKIRAGLSSPSRQEFDSLERGTTLVLYEGEIHKVERDLLYRRVEEHTKKLPTSRKRIQKGGELTGDYAQGLLNEKDKKEADKRANAEAKALQKIVNQERKQLHAEGVIARRIEKLRKQELEKILPGDIGASHLYIPIPDRETEARLAKEAQLTGFQLLLEAAEEVVETRSDGFIFLDSCQSKASSSDNSDDSDDSIYSDTYFTLV